jgi:hypothetical protein
MRHIMGEILIGHVLSSSLMRCTYAISLGLLSFGFQLQIPDQYERVETVF